MVWFKVDDGFYDHPKFLDVPNAAIGLWAKAGAWCSRHLTDGVIPASQVTMLRGTKSQVNALISTGIWRHSETESGAKAYAFHGWNEYQPTRGQVEKDRAESAERQRKSRERKRDEQEQSENVTRDSQTPVTRDSHESHKGVSQRPDPTRPDPTPVPNGTESKPRERGGYSPEFETFWATYPRKEAKRQAWKAWGKAIERATPERITAGARRYASDPNRSDQFTKHGSTWLNADGWEDEPLPSPAGRDNTHAAWSTPKGYDPADWLRKDNEPAFDYIDAEVVQLREIGR